MPPGRSRAPAVHLLAAVVLPALACRPDDAPPAEKAADSPTPDQIVVCGRRFPIDVPVVLWSDPGGYNAYYPGPIFADTGPIGLRYEPGRSWADSSKGLSLADLARGIDLLVVHYDASGFSRRCFRALQDERMLSAHFMLDVDGTLYQTLDLRDQAWHGRSTNPRSIGVEIANLGVLNPDSRDDPHKKRRWYVPDNGRLRLEIPPEYGDPGIRTTGPFYAATNEPVRGRIHDQPWEQVDFTPQQYESLAKLTVALRRLFPRIALDAPRGPDGRVRTDVLSRAELAGFSGIIGHYHITTEKYDPGPAFDWERLLRDGRQLEERADKSHQPSDDSESMR